MNCPLDDRLRIPFRLILAAAVFERRLRAKFPDASIDVETVAVGGSHSRQWLWPDRFAGRPGCEWRRIAEARPDLVTIEFVNDASARWEHLHREGIPYVTLLLNGINHPDDRGHALFADELIRCFD